MIGAQRVNGNAELIAVALERLNLDTAQLVTDASGDGGAVGGHVVIGGGDGAVRASGGRQGRRTRGGGRAWGVRARPAARAAEVSGSRSDGRSWRRLGPCAGRRNARS